MKKCWLYLAATAGFALLPAVLVGVAVERGRAIEEGTTSGNAELVGSLRLTDLALWTEARYSRHPSQADFFAPFQDAPAAFDHFPAGSVMAPPREGAWK